MVASWSFSQSSNGKIVRDAAKRLQAILFAFTATHTKRKKYLSSFPQRLAEKSIRKSLENLC